MDVSKENPIENSILELKNMFDQFLRSSNENQSSNRADINELKDAIIKIWGYEHNIVWCVLLLWRFFNFLVICDDDEFFDSFLLLFCDDGIEVAVDVK